MTDLSKMSIVEGSWAVADTVRKCRPHVVAAYPITPQTHIVEDLAKFVADGEMDGECLTVESEFGAASVALGASASGARTYSSTSSQGLALMLEVIYCLAGMRLPVNLTIANRSVSSPLSIWNDQQDIMMVRDSGCISVVAEDVQEACDLTVQCYKLGEDNDIMLPTLVNMDGFILTHTFEPVELLDQSMVDDFLPTFEPVFVLDPENPVSMGAYADPSIYTEIRYDLHRANLAAEKKFVDISREFAKTFGRDWGGVIEEYQCDDAEIIILAAGTIIGTIKEAVDAMRRKGKKVGAIKLRLFRPFPHAAIQKALGSARAVVVLEKCLSYGYGGAISAEIRSSMYGKSDIPVLGLTIGLGGRDIRLEDVEEVVDRAEKAADTGEYEPHAFTQVKKEAF